MSTPASRTNNLTALSGIQRVQGQPGDPYEVIFLGRDDRILVPLTEWYRLRKGLGPASTRTTYLTCLVPFLNFLAEKNCPWNASAERLRPVLIEFHRDRLCCQIHPGNGGESIEIVATRDTPLRPSTMRVLRAALRDFYLVLKDAGLYAFSNPLSSVTLVALKREQLRAMANRGAPEHAGIRGETREQSRRRPTAFIQHPEDQGWKPNLRKELADVREGMHKVLNAMLDSEKVAPREKAVLELLQNTGARLHEIVLMTVGGYRNEGIAGQAQVVNKGSMGREVKTIYFGFNPTVEEALATYIDRVRPLQDPHGRSRLSEIGDQEPLFLTERGTPYSVKCFYYHWYQHYKLLQSECPVRISPHDIRHLFITEYLIRLKLACHTGDSQFDKEKYTQTREAFGSLIMGWSSVNTINFYDHTRDGEEALFVLSDLQKDHSKRRYGSGALVPAERQGPQQDAAQPKDKRVDLPRTEEVVWMHDAETLAWIKQKQQQAKQR